MSRYQEAVEAVRELHKPTKDHWLYEDGQCAHCNDLAREAPRYVHGGFEEIPSPCPTVVAIAAALTQTEHWDARHGY